MKNSTIKGFRCGEKQFDFWKKIFLYLVLYLGHYVFFLCFRWAWALDLRRALKKKNICFFSAQR